MLDVDDLAAIAAAVAWVTEKGERGVPFTDIFTDIFTDVSALDGNYRVTDEERDAAVSLLVDHFTVGRLDSDEYEQRVGEVLRAKT
jgi:hypothetical protein